MFSLIYAVLLHPFPYDGADRIMNPVVIDMQHPDDRTWFSLSKAQFDDLRLAAPVDSALGFDNSEWRSPAEHYRKTSSASTSQRMPELSLVCARFSAATSSHPMQRTAAIPSLFSTTASGSATSAAIPTLSGERWRSITPPTPSLG
jgi:hypothetical protein